MNLTDNQKHWIAWLLIAALTTAMSTFLGVNYPVPQPPVFTEVDDEIIALGTTHFTNISVEDATVTDDLAVTDDASIGGDFTVTGDASTSGDFAVTGDASVGGGLTVTGDNTVTGNILGRTNIISKTASYTLLAAESGSIATNIGASAGLTYSLPSAAAGLHYCFYIGASHAITINPASSDYILHLTNAADNRILDDTAGDCVCLTAINTVHWIPDNETGTWTDNN